ncbi:hypothetical protein ACFLZM_01985 [Thermodesulfobacteriota bacterium]
MSCLWTDSSMVETEIQKAKSLFACYGQAILEDKICSDLLKDYRKAIDTTWETMGELKVVKACIACSDKRIGGCCFNGVESWYDDMLFLINLLLGGKIPESRKTDDGCMFVGPNGCELIARYSFCINYLCNPLKELLNSSARKQLTAIAGREIFCGIQVEQAISKWLASNSGTGHRGLGGRRRANKTAATSNMAEKLTRTM